MKVIVYTGDNGFAQVLTPVYPEQFNEESEAQLLERLQQKDVPTYSDGSQRKSFIKDASSPEIIRMGTMYESWKLAEDGSLYWDHEAGKALKKREFRFIRKPLLERLDVEFMRSLELGDLTATKAIAAKKQALRDVTLIDLSEYDTPEKLNAFIPEVLRNL